MAKRTNSKTQRNVKSQRNAKSVSTNVDERNLCYWWLPLGYSVRIMECKTGLASEAESEAFDVRDRVEIVVRDALEKAGFNVAPDMAMAKPYTGSWTGVDRKFRPVKQEAESMEESDPVDYSKMNVGDLRAIAQSLGIETKGMRKAELIAEIEAA